MNKKIVAIAAAVLIVSCLVSCTTGTGNEPTTTLPPLTTVPTVQSVLTTGSSVEVSDSGDAAPTYILTTQYGQTMPTVVTTAFSVNAVVQTSGVVIPSSFVNPGVTTPSVLQSSIATSATTTTKATTTTAKTTTEQTTESTTAKPTETVRKSLDIASAYVESNRRFVIDFELDGWEGGVVSSTTLVQVVIDGKQYPASAKVSGKANSDGYGTITVDISDFEPGDGANIVVNGGAGVVRSKNSTQRSNEFSASGTVRLDTEE